MPKSRAHLAQEKFDFVHHPLLVRFFVVNLHPQGYHTIVPLFHVETALAHATIQTDFDFPVQSCSLSYFSSQSKLQTWLASGFTIEIFDSLNEWAILMG